MAVVMPLLWSAGVKSIEQLVWTLT